MRERVEWRVEDDLPPKKDGANSMWAKESESGRLIALRRAALAAMAGRGPLSSTISLELEVHVPARGHQRLGDLDNFITGVCDGLMAAAPRCRLHPRWGTPELASLHPSRTIAIQDDDAVVSITAKKVAGAASPWYHVVLEGELGPPSVAEREVRANHGENADGREQDEADRRERRGLPGLTGQ